MSWPSFSTATILTSSLPDWLKNHLTCGHSKRRNLPWFGNSAASFSLQPRLKEDLASVIWENHYRWCVLTELSEWESLLAAAVCSVDTIFTSFPLSTLIRNCVHLIWSSVPLRALKSTVAQGRNDFLCDYQQAKPSCKPLIPPAAGSSSKSYSARVHHRNWFVCTIQGEMWITIFFCSYWRSRFFQKMFFL